MLSPSSVECSCKCGVENGCIIGGLGRQML